MIPERTVMEVFEKTASANANSPALKVKRGGQWKTWTWSQYREDVHKAAKALLHLGVERNTGVSIIGFNSPEWAISDIGAIYAGAFPAGIYTTNSPEQCQYIAAHSDSSVVMVENAHQLDKFLQIRDQLPLLKKIVMFEGSHADPDVLSWDEFLALSENTADDALQARIDEQGPDDVCTLIYTSGTTGDPKAVMISHDNMTFTAQAAMNSFDGYAGKLQHRFLSYLPFSHIAEQIVSLHCPVICGGETWFAESIEKLGDNLRECHPTIFLAVPRVWEKIQAKIVAAAAGNTGLKKKIGAWARAKGLEAGYADQAGKPRPMFTGIADKLVFSKVKQQLGLDQCVVQITSAAPISKDTLEFFLSLGVPIMEVYGMSECTGPATLSLPNRYRTGSVGWVLPGAEIKAAEDGEICMRGRHVFKGYLKNAEATASTLDDQGWLHSGDLGEVDGQGFVRITGRKKELIITAGGENIAPNYIEGKMKAIPAVSQFVVVGDRRKHLAALVTLDETKLKEAIAASGSSASTMAEAAVDAKLHGWLMEQVNEVNSGLARVQTVKKIKILPQDLSVDGGELTPTMKVKRRIINTKYADEIESFYS
ncbi:MAG: AMP-binding protein [Myxococcota bacterium]|nr:AMP-binding protein [Myxococcota bacterium]